MIRNPVVAGQFYPGNPSELEQMVVSHMANAGAEAEAPSLAAMVPHAGYPFSGPVCGRTIAEANLSQTLLLLGPNHSGRGARMAVWPDGQWELPGGGLAVDEQLAGALLEGVDDFTEDTAAHMGEHSIEVVLPFLRAKLGSRAAIVPVSVSEPDPSRLLDAGAQVASVLEGLGQSVSMVISSDMSHYVSAERAETLDRMALLAVEELDAAKLYETVRQNRISMCGVLPMTLGLAAAVKLGAQSARIVDYATSGDATGDYSAVVGYAGVIVD